MNMYDYIKYNMCIPISKCDVEPMSMESVQQDNIMRWIDELVEDLTREHTIVRRYEIVLATATTDIIQMDR
jgi:hypothetical protein